MDDPAPLDRSVLILQLEDDPVDAELVQVALDAAGMPIQIDRTQSEFEFSEALRTRQYDVILADFELPTYDGISAWRFVQQLCPETPFIFVTGTLGEEAARNACAQGAADYVLKNKLARLVPAVRHALAESENRRKRRQAEQALR